MNGCVVAEKTLVCYKGDDRPCTNKQTKLFFVSIKGNPNKMTELVAPQ